MHTKNLPVVIISQHPLRSKITFSKSTPYIRRCLEIIESARIVWGYYSDEYKSCCYETVDGVDVPKKFPPYSNLKLTAACSIQSWYAEHSDLILTSQKTPEAIKKAVQDARRYARPGIDNDITDKEILAIFAICEAFDAVYKIQRGNSEDAIKEKILTANMFLDLARTGLEPEKQIPQKTKGAKKLFYSYDSTDKLSLFFKNGKPVPLTKTEAKLFLLLKEDRRTPEEIIEHVWEVYRQKDIEKKKEKGNVKELRNRINNKCRVPKIGVENLISKLTEGGYSLTVEVVEQ